MIKKILSIMLIAVVSIFSKDSTWIKIYDNFNSLSPTALRITSDNGFIFTGHNRINSFGEGNAFLIRTDSTGNIIWTNTYSDNYNNEVNSFVSTPDNGYLLLGSSTYDGYTLTSLWVAKVNDSGNLLWSKTIETNQTGKETDGVSIQPTLDKNYIVSFTKWSVEVGDSVGIMKINNEGEKIWEKIIDAGNAYNIIQTPNREYALLYKYSNYDSGSFSLTLVITDSLGNIRIRKRYPEFDPIYGNSIKQTQDNGFMICATFSPTFTMIKVDKNGEILWSSSYNGRTEDFNGLQSFTQTEDNGYVITGFINKSILMYKISESGKTIWKKYYNLNTFDNTGIAINKHKNGYIILGRINTETSDPPYYSVYQPILIKTDSLGSNLFSDEITDISNKNENYVSNYFLDQNYPNPFNPNTIIQYSVPNSSVVTIKVYDILGNEITTLINEVKPAGTYQIEFNGSNLSSGIYLYKLQTGNNVLVKKMILLK